MDRSDIVRYHWISPDIVGCGIGYRRRGKLYLVKFLFKLLYGYQISTSSTPHADAMDVLHKISTMDIWF